MEGNKSCNYIYADVKLNRKEKTPLNLLDILIEKNVQWDDKSEKQQYSNSINQVLSCHIMHKHMHDAFKVHKGCTRQGLKHKNHKLYSPQH